jgi:protein ImuA
MGKLFSENEQQLERQVNQRISLDACLDRADIWKGHRYKLPAYKSYKQDLKDASQADSSISSISTGYAVLDALLPSRGWSASELTEIAVPEWGQGEMRLLMPCLAELAARGKRIALVAPPMTPYAPAMLQAGVALEQLVWIQTEQSSDMLWSTERLLRCSDVGAVLFWGKLDFQQARRLHMAAQAGGSHGFVFTRSLNDQSSLPLSIRLQLKANQSGLAVHFRKLKSQCGEVSVQLNWH